LISVFFNLDISIKTKIPKNQNTKKLIMINETKEKKKKEKKNL